MMVKIENTVRMESPAPVRGGFCYKVLAELIILNNL